MTSHRAGRSLKFSQRLRAGLTFGSALVFGVCLSACATTETVTLSEADPSVSWKTTLETHTRRHEVYDEVIREADLRVTLVTPRLRKAFLDHRQEFSGRIADDLQYEFVALGQRPDEGVDAPMMKGPQGEEEVIFIVAFYARDQANKDLASSYSIWTTELRRGEISERPSKIEPLRYDPAITAIFPFIDRFDQIYLMRFPLVDAKSGLAMISPGGKPLVLEVKSALGSARVQWELQE